MKRVFRNTQLIPLSTINVSEAGKRKLAKEGKSMILRTNIILYVKDQRLSRDFYTRLLQQEPVLDVPGMTEFAVADRITLGLMPITGIRRLLGERIPDPLAADGIPKAELYLTVKDPSIWHDRALQAGGKELLPLQKMNWGDNAAYSADPDGHILAFACPSV